MDAVFAGNPEFNQAMKQWIESRIWDDGSTLPPSVMMGVFDKGKIVAAVAFHDYHEKEGVIEISAASESKRWLTRNVLHAIFSYVFVTAKCQLCVARIEPENTSLLRIFKAYGFNDIRIPRLLGREKDQIVLTLTDDDWLANKFERKAA